MCGMCRPVRPLLEIAAAFGRVDREAVDDDLAAIAACALAARCAPPDEQLATLDAAMEPFAVSDAHLGIDDLLLDRVLARWSGAPVLLCAVAAEAGLRAGLDVAVAGDGRRHGVVHRRRPDRIWLPRLGVRRLGDDERTAFRLRCGHQIAFAALAAIVERATRGGDVSVALHATDLRLRLPLAPPLRARVEAERAGLLAALN